MNGTDRTRKGWLIRVICSAAVLFSLVTPVAATESDPEQPPTTRPTEAPSESEIIPPEPPREIGVDDGIGEIDPDSVPDEFQPSLETFVRPPREERDYMNSQRTHYGLPLLSDDDVLPDAAALQIYRIYRMPLTESEVPEWAARVDRRDDARDLFEEIVKMDGFFFGRIDNKTDLITVFVRADGVEAAARVAAGNELVTVQSSDFSLKDYEALDLERLGLEGIVYDIDLDPKGWIVKIDQRQEGAAEAAQVARSQPDVLEVEMVDIGPRISARCQQNRDRCAAYGGGMALFNTNNTYSGSTNAIWANTSGEVAIGTAYHVVIGKSAMRIGVSRDDNGAPYNVTGDLPFSVPNDDEIDLALVRPRSSGNVWTRREEFGLLNVLWRDFTNWQQEINTVSTAMQNDRVCVSARRSVWTRCGKIVDLTETVEPINGVGQTWVNLFEFDMDNGSNNFTRTLHPGDSGGMVAIEASPNRIVGSVTAIEDLQSGNGCSLQTNPVNTNVCGDDVFAARATDFAAEMPGWSLYDPGNTGRRRTVIATYDSALIRAPESAAAVTNWANWLNVNCSARLTDFYKAFLNGPEMLAARPLTTTNSSTNVDNAKRRVRRLYLTLFARDGDTGGVNYWSNRIMTDPFGPELNWQKTVNYFIGHWEHQGYRQGGAGGQPAPCAL